MPGGQTRTRNGTGSDEHKNPTLLISRYLGPVAKHVREKVLVVIKITLK